MNKDRFEQFVMENALKWGIYNVKTPSILTDRISLYARIGQRFNLTSDVDCQPSYSVPFGVGVNILSLRNRVEIDAYFGFDSRISGNYFGSRDPNRIEARHITVPEFKVNVNYDFWSD
jgi:hypothetical protein